MYESFKGVQMREINRRGGLEFSRAAADCSLFLILLRS